MSEMPSPELIAQQLRKPSSEMGTVTGNSMNKTNESLYDLVLDTMQLQKGVSVMEIGFGNGKLFDKLFNLCAELKISGLDYSADMVAEAVANNRQHIDKGQLELKQGNSDNIPFADNSFDKVFCCNVIYFWDDPTVHLKEIYRVLKPGGHFYAGFRSRSSMEAFPFTQFGFTLYEAKDWETIIQANGFAHETTTTRKEYLEIEENKFELTACCTVARK